MPCNDSRVILMRYTHRGVGSLVKPTMNLFPHAHIQNRMAAEGRNKSFKNVLTQIRCLQRIFDKPCIFTSLINPMALETVVESYVLLILFIREKFLFEFDTLF